jgi:CRISPR type IV-associated protein Csf1
MLTRALGIKPVGAPSKVAQQCSLCGGEIKIGDLVSPFRPGPSFMDDLSLIRTGKVVCCGYCAPLLTKNILSKTQAFFSTSKEARSLLRQEYRAWFWSNLPEPPFVVAFNNTKMGHVAWKAPVTLDSRAVWVQHGMQAWPVRAHRLAEWVKAAKDVLGSKEKAKGRSPFISLDPKIADFETALLRPDLITTATENQPEALQFLREMNVMEAWALAALLFSEPVLPPLIDLGKK